MTLCNYKNGIDFKNICRACMGIDDTNTKINDTITVGKHSLEALQILNLLTEVQLNKEFPDKICFNCLESLKDIYKFKLQLEKSESVLRKHLMMPKNSTTAGILHYLDLEKNIPENKKTLNVTQKDHSLEHAMDYADIIEPKIELVECREEIVYLYETDMEIEEQNNGMSDRFDNSLSSDTSRQEDISGNIESLLKKYGVKSTQPELKNNIKQQIKEEVSNGEYTQNIHAEDEKEKNAISSHYRSVKTMKKNRKKLPPVSCQVCHITLKSKYILKTHLERHSKFMCLHCEKCFDDKIFLKRHMPIHKIETHCKICDKTYPTLSSLKRHLIGHTGQKPHLCTLCGRSYTNATGLNFHLKVHKNVKPFKCNICDKAFIVQCHLDAHSKIHTGEKPFKCSHCERAFVKKFDLKRHEAIHTGDKPYKCEFCDRSFILKVHYNYHTRMHKNERPFVCHICSQGFIRRYFLKNHYLKKHESLAGSIFNNSK